jgi:3-deoxy-D-manno-octulosonic-acid transferase
MASRLLSSSALLAIGSAVAAAYVRFVYRTSDIRRYPQDTDETLFSQHPQILAMWHGQFFMLPKIKPERRPADVRCMVARHGDAELVGAVLQRFGMQLIRGAGAGSRKRDRGGATAMREALRALHEGATVAMTADVPPGPARRAGEGIATLGKLSGRPVIPCAMATSRFITLNNWSRFTINLPFSKLGVVVGDPILVPEDADEDAIEAARLAIEGGLALATSRAYALAGATDPLSPVKQVDRAKPGFSLALYRALTRLAAPLAPLMLAIRTRRGKEERERRGERYGVASLERPEGFLAWFHAASVGETNAVLPVIEAIASAHDDAILLLTTGTVTSATLARARLPKRAMHQYVPLDNQNYVRRFLDHWQPDLAVLVESEIWPNLLL